MQSMQSQSIAGLAGSSRTLSTIGRRAPVPACASAERTPHRPRRPHSAQHPPALAGALPEHARGPCSPLGSPALRSLALGAVPLPRRQLEEQYSDAFSEAAVATERRAKSAQQQRWRHGELAGGLPRLPSLPRTVTRQLAAAGRRLEQLRRRQGAGAAQDEAPLSQEALTLVLLATAVSFICSIDRAAMSVAILPMSDQFHWDNTVKGAVASAFFAGYMVTNLCGGYLATRYSPKTVLASGVVLWSLFTIATPGAAAGNLGELMMARAMMGVGEGVTYPSIQNLARNWVPDSKRSRALAFIYSGHQLGTIGSYLLCPLLIAHLGWESIFWGFGSLGFVWLLFWQPLVRDEPSATPLAAAAAPAMLAAPLAAAAAPAMLSAPLAAAAAPAPAAPAPPPLRVSDVPWGEFARSPAFWAIVAAQSTVSVGNVLAFSWLPTFYNEVYGVDVASSSFLSVLPFVATVVATNAAGWIADGLINNKVMDKTSTRKLMQAIASLGPAACLMKLAVDQGQGSTSSMVDAVALVTAWVSLCGFSAAGYGSNHQDITQKYTGVLFGLSNGIASLCASASIYATGQVLHTTHDWSLVFEMAAGLYAVGAVAYLKFASCEEQFPSEREAPATSAGAELEPARPKAQ